MFPGEHSDLLSDPKQYTARTFPANTNWEAIYIKPIKKRDIYFGEQCGGGVKDFAAYYIIPRLLAIWKITNAEYLSRKASLITFTIQEIFVFFWQTVKFEFEAYLVWFWSLTKNLTPFKTSMIDSKLCFVCISLPLPTITQQWNLIFRRRPDRITPHW